MVRSAEVGSMDQDLQSHEPATEPENQPNMPTTIGQVLAIFKLYFIMKMREYCKTFWYELFLPIVACFIYLMIMETSDQPSKAPNIPMVVTGMMSISFIFHFFHSIRWLSIEKELRMLMHTMGLKKFSYYMSTSLAMLCLSIPISLIFGLMITTRAREVTVSVSFVTFPLIFIIYPIQLTSLIFASGSIVHGWITFIAIVVVHMISFSFTHKAFVSLCNLSGKDYKFILMILAHFSPLEAVRQMTYGFSYANGTEMIDSDCTDYTYPSPVLVVSLMTFWTVAFYSFAWYFDEICPWQASRSPKSLLYCFKGKIKRLAESFSATTTSIKDPFEGYNPKYFEKAPRNELGIYIDNVTKKFAKSTAVDTISLSIYSGQTTLLLGHNGAGKTTLMNMIISNLAPDDGKLYIGGIDTCSDEARSSLGLCPQESILLDKLTVDEHLDLFAGIKSGYSGFRKQQHIDTIVKNVSLEGHRDKMCSELSGGMKRKLSLALAFVGDSKVLILDEPSSGLDPESRKFIWNSIRQYRSKRTVLLSTQHMEEADYLGDRIAIMSAGKIVCCGSSVFLKKTFGSAYKLRIECNKESENTILAAITKHLPKARLDIEQQAAANFRHVNDITIELIPDADKQDDQLIGMLEELEICKDSLGIKSFGLKCSTVEDVFLNSAKIFSDNALRSTGDTMLAIETFADKIALMVSPQETRDVSTYRLFTAFVKKHLLVLYRDCWSTIIFRIIIPVAALIWTSYSFAGESACTLYPSDLVRRLELRVLAVIMCFFLSVPLFGAFALVPPGENATKFKLMQMCSKANYYIYWASTLMVDLMIIIIYYFVFVISLEFWLKDDQLRMFGGRFELYSSLLMLMIVFGLATLSMVYLLSNCFQDLMTTIFSMFIVLNLRLIAALITLFLAIVTIHIDAEPLNNFAYYVVPSETFSVTLTGFIGTTLLVNCEITDESQRIHLYYWSSKLIMGALILLGQALSFAIILCLIETRRIDTYSFLDCSTYCIDGRSSRKDNLDGDVKIEERRAKEILSNPSGRARNALIASDLVKSYTRSFRAVDGLTFAVDKSECFGLLGVNGAGKTTAFSMLSGDIFPDHGSIVCNNLRLSDGADSYTSSIGFDPQTNPSTELTPEDAMYFMARLRGIEESRIKAIVGAFLSILNMQEHASKKLSRLSGGSKRKLSLAMAIIGSPPVLMLDEPTAGIDPVARRNIWLALSALKSRLKTSIIISSHAMEECEAICDRLTIMVNGRMRCIGSFQHLRSKFGQQGYVVRIQFEAIPGSSNHQKKQASNINEFLSKNLHCSVTIDDISTNSVVYKINDGKIPRSSVFKVLRSLKHINPHISYLVGDTSLEDIFVSLAREHRTLV